MLVGILLFTILGLLVWLGALIGNCEHLERRLQSQEAYIETLEEKALTLETTLYKFTVQQYRAAPPAETYSLPGMVVMSEKEITL